jgi:2-amino-4-hydroxy-6-hydroxymethyldihydropteridine diphosphokinase
MIIVALGSNMPGPWGDTRQSVERAAQELNIWPLKLVRLSTLIDTDPFGRKNQPRFVNAVAIVSTHLPPDALLRRLHMIEHKGGRRRASRWGPRTIDLDLIDYHGLSRPARMANDRNLVLPHPGLEHRRFVLVPLVEIAPQWRSRRSGLTAAAMLKLLRD